MGVAEHDVRSLSTTTTRLLWTGSDAAEYRCDDDGGLATPPRMQGRPFDARSDQELQRSARIGQAARKSGEEILARQNAQSVMNWLRVCRIFPERTP